MGMGTIVERVMAQREEALAERDAALARVKDLELANDLRPELERADVIVAGEMHRRAEMIVSLESERDAALGRVETFESEVMPMRDAFGRCRAILGLGDRDDMPSVVRHVSMMQSELAESQGEVKRLSAALKVSLGTSDKLLAQLRSKEVGA